MRRFILPLLMMLTACAPMSETGMASRTIIAETTLPPMKTFAARAPRGIPVSNATLLRDFMDLSFQMESGTPLPFLTRFEGPITVRVTGRPSPTLLPDLRNLLARLTSEAGIQIALTPGTDASITVESVPGRSIRKALPQAACFVVPNVTSLSEFRKARRKPKTDWAALRMRETLLIVVPSDVSPQEVRDCLHEELAQALGPLNDLYRLPQSVFNDDNVQTVLSRFDMLILRATYAPELSSGMTRQQVAARLPGILERINPGGGSANPPAPAMPNSQAYVRAIQKALGPGASRAARRKAAEDAVRIATSAGWTDSRRGFAYYAKGRVLQPVDDEAAQRAFRQADSFYARSPETRLHRAYVATHLAAHTLANGDPARARALVAPHIPQAREAQNAALVATLQLIEAEALRVEGRVAESNAVRLDSLGWARYGFGADWAVQTKLQEISALTRHFPPV